MRLVTMSVFTDRVPEGRSQKFEQQIGIWPVLVCKSGTGRRNESVVKLIIVDTAAGEHSSELWSSVVEHV